MILKKQNIFCFIFFNIFFHLGLVGAEDSKITVLSLNVLHPESMDLNDHFPNGRHFTNALWKTRKAKIQNLINAMDPTILCFQETSENMANSLQLHLAQNKGKHYQVAQAQNKGRSGGGVSILFDDSKISLIASQGFALSNGTFDQAGAVAWTLFYPGPSYRFKELEIKNCLIVASVHLSRANDRSQSAQGQAQMGSLIQSLQKFARNVLTNVGKQVDLSENIILIAGDMNTFYEEVANDFMQMNEVRALNLQMVPHKLWTVSRQGFSGKEFASIDHILYSPGITETKILIPSDNYQSEEVVTAKKFINLPELSLFTDVGPSDHLPLIISFSMPKVQQDLSQFARCHEVLNQCRTYDFIIENWFKNIDQAKSEIRNLAQQGIQDWKEIFDKLKLAPEIKTHVFNSIPRRYRFQALIETTVNDSIKNAL